MNSNSFIKHRHTHIHTQSPIVQYVAPHQPNYLMVNLLCKHTQRHKEAIRMGLLYTPLNKPAVSGLTKTE